jgi:Disaggregatase related repeat
LTMGLQSTHSEIDEMPNGVIRHTQHMRAIAYRESGILKPLVQDWDDGDVDRPHMVSRAPLMVSSAGNGTRRIHPTREADRWLEMGAPFVKVGGTWTRAALGAPTRSKGRLTWTRPNYNMYIDHGGHMIKLAILLKNGFVPEDGMIAFPVGISGLTRAGNEIRRDGVPVLQLRPLHVEDLDNPLDVRPITHQFTTLNGQPYMICTLPSLTGMSRPLIDPTLSLQPNAADGKDALIIDGLSNYNYGVFNIVVVGNSSGDPYITRTLIQFDLSSVPASSVVSGAMLSLYALTDNATSAATYNAYRLKRAWAEGTRGGTADIGATGVTWSWYDAAGTTWQTAGGDGANDRESGIVGSRDFTATETLNQFKDFSLTPSLVQEWISGAFSNNGMLIKSGSESSTSKDRYDFASSDNTTAANRPKLEVIYAPPTSGNALFSSLFASRFQGVFG